MTSRSCVSCLTCRSEKARFVNFVLSMLIVFECFVHARGENRRFLLVRSTQSQGQKALELTCLSAFWGLSSVSISHQERGHFLFSMPTYWKGENSCVNFALSMYSSVHTLTKSSALDVAFSKAFFNFFSLWTHSWVLMFLPSSSVSLLRRTLKTSLNSYRPWARLRLVYTGSACRTSVSRWVTSCGTLFNTVTIAPISCFFRHTFCRCCVHFRLISHTLFAVFSLANSVTASGYRFKKWCSKWPFWKVLDWVTDLKFIFILQNIKWVKDSLLIQKYPTELWIDSKVILKTST